MVDEPFCAACSRCARSPLRICECSSDLDPLKVSGLKIELVSLAEAST